MDWYQCFQYPPLPFVQYPPVEKLLSGFELNIYTPNSSTYQPWNTSQQQVIWNWRQIIVWLTSSGLGWLWVDGCTRPTDGLDRTAKLQPTRATIATIANHCKQLQQLQQLQTMETIATITNNCKQLQTIANNGNNCNSCKQLQTIANNCNNCSNCKQLHSIAKNCKHWQTTKNGKQ